MDTREITALEAIYLLPDGETVHVFKDTGSAIFGAGHARENIIAAINDATRIELTGDGARSMGHGIAVYPKGASRQSDILFVETDRAKLDAFDPPEAVAEAHTCPQCGNGHFPEGAKFCMICGLKMEECD